MRTNAEVAKRCEAGDRPPSGRLAFSLLQWRNFKDQIAGLRAEDPHLWRDLVDMDAQIDMTRHGQKQPRSDDLTSLADRLDKAAH